MSICLKEMNVFTEITVSDMWTIIIDIITIHFICVFVIDISGFIDQIENVVKRSVPKPFSCSLCSIFWITTGYMLYMYDMNILHAVGCGCLNALFNEFTYVVLNKLIDKIKQL